MRHLTHLKKRPLKYRMFDEPALDAAMQGPRSFTINATYLKTHRTASSLRLKKGIWVS